MSEIGDKLAQLRVRFIARAAADRAAIEQALDRLEAPPDATDALATIRRAAHSLSGSAGIFGFSEISAVAEEVEYALDSPPAETAELRSLCRPLLDLLDRLG